MPCYDPRSDLEKSYDNGATERELREEIQTLEIRCDNFVHMLCEVLSVAEEREDYSDKQLSDRVYIWWTEHKEWDRLRMIRLAKEAEREKGRKEEEEWAQYQKDEILARFTPKEKKILGLE